MDDFLLLKGFSKDLGENKIGNLGKVKDFHKLNFIKFSFWYGKKIIEAFAILNCENIVTSIYYDVIEILYSMNDNKLKYNLANQFIKGTNYKIASFNLKEMIYDEIDVQKANEYKLNPCLFSIANIIINLNNYYKKVYRDVSYNSILSCVSRGYSWLKSLDMLIFIPNFFLGILLLVLGLVLMPMNISLIVIGGVVLLIGIIALIFFSINNSCLKKVKKLNLCNNKEKK